MSDGFAKLSAELRLKIFAYALPHPEPHPGDGKRQFSRYMPDIRYANHFFDRPPPLLQVSRMWRKEGYDAFFLSGDFKLSVSFDGEDEPIGCEPLMDRLALQLYRRPLVVNTFTICMINSPYADFVAWRDGDGEPWTLQEVQEYVATVVKCRSKEWKEPVWTYCKPREIMNKYKVTADEESDSDADSDDGSEE